MESLTVRAREELRPAADDGAPRVEVAGDFAARGAVEPHALDGVRRGVGVDAVRGGEHVGLSRLFGRAHGVEEGGGA